MPTDYQPNFFQRLLGASRDGRLALCEYPGYTVLWPLLLYGYALELMAISGNSLYSDTTNFIYVAGLALMLGVVGFRLGVTATLVALAVVAGVVFIMIQYTDVVGSVTERSLAVGDGVPLVLTLLLSVPFVLALVLPRAKSRWLLTPARLTRIYGYATHGETYGNEVKVVPDYADLATSILLGLGGDIKIVRKATDQEVDRIRNVPFLFFLWNYVNALFNLGVTPKAKEAAKRD